jgi:hypothetical protein
MNKMKFKLYFIIIALTIGCYGVALAETELSVNEYGDFIHLVFKYNTDPPNMNEYYIRKDLITFVEVRNNGYLTIKLSEYFKDKKYIDIYLKDWEEASRKAKDIMGYLE